MAFPAAPNAKWMPILQRSWRAPWTHVSPAAAAQSGSVRCMFSIKYLSEQALIMDLWIDIEKAIDFPMNPDQLHNCFRPTDLQTRSMHMPFLIVAVSELSFTDLLSLHYIHLPVESKLCARQSRSDGILKAAKRNKLREQNGKSSLWPRDKGNADMMVFIVFWSVHSN